MLQNKPHTTETAKFCREQVKVGCMSNLFRTQERSFPGTMRAFLPSSVRPPCCKESIVFIRRAFRRFCSLMSSLLRLLAAKTCLNKFSSSSPARGCRLLSPGVSFSEPAIVSTFQEKFDNLTQARWGLYKRRCTVDQICNPSLLWLLQLHISQQRHLLPVKIQLVMSAGGALTDSSDGCGVHDAFQ